MIRKLIDKLSVDPKSIPILSIELNFVIFVVINNMQSIIKNNNAILNPFVII